MNPQQPDVTAPHRDGAAKVSLLIMSGILIGTLACSAYFIFLVPKPEPVIVEKIVEKVVVTTAPKSMVPPKIYNFRLIKTMDNNGSSTVLSLDDSVVVETIQSAFKKDTKLPVWIDNKNFKPEYTIVSSGYAITAVEVPKDGGGNDYFVIDLNTKKITDRFSTHDSYYIDQGTFFFGNDVTGLGYYSYGATSSVKIINSNLTGLQTYREYEGPAGSSKFGVIATTTNSITFGVYDSTQSVTAPRDDVAYFKKIGERTFIIP